MRLLRTAIVCHSLIAWLLWLCTLVAASPFAGEPRESSRFSLAAWQWQETLAPGSVTIRPVPGDDGAMIQQAVDRFDTVNLLGEFDCSGSVFLDSGTRLVTPRATPATIRRAGDCIRLLVPNGIDIRINNLLLDFNFGGIWREYASLIALALPDDATVKAQQRGQLRFTNVQFIASTPMGRLPGQTGDCFCISFTHDSPDVIEDTLIAGVRCYVPGVQLTGNGNGPGYRRLTIRDFEVWGGYANAVALSSRETRRQTIFEDVLIERGIIREAGMAGIFVGQDGSSAAGDVWIERLTIRNNHVELADSGLWYQHAILIRGGQADGSMSNAIVEGNTFDVRGSAGRQASWLTHVPAKSGSKLDLMFNRIIGPPTDSHARGVEVKQSGNRRVDDKGSVELKVAA